MEFHEKLQQLRKKKNITQEELAASLFVSRTAVSKWESGRGYPNIESLKALSRFYAVSIDELLSGDELLTIAQEDARKTKQHYHGLIFGLLDLSVLLFLFLPLFGQTDAGSIQAVSLLALAEASPLLKGCYYTAVVGMTLWGVVTLALQNCTQAFWVRSQNRISLILGGLSLLLFIISQQPYGAVVFFLLLMVKVLILL